MISGLHEQVLSSLPDGVTVQDRDFNILYQNTAMVEAFGSHIGGKCYDIYERRDEICEGCGVRKVFRTGKPTMVLRTAFQEDGTISYWENACFPLFDEAGNIVAGVEVCRNISDRVSLEEEVKDRNIELGQLNKQLNRRTAQLQSTLAERREIERRLKDEIVAHKKRKKALQVTQFSIDNATEAVHWVREDGSIYYVNDAACKALGYARQELLSMSISDINPDLPKSSWARRWKEIREKKSALFESIQKRKDGSLYPVDVAVNHIQLGDQEYTCAFIRDITERKEAQQRQQGLMDELGEAYRELKAAQNQIVLQDKMACIGQINQVLLNILVNAAQAIAAQGRTDPGSITVRTVLEESCLVCQISDDGPGIPSELERRVFEPFFTTKQVGKGIGLGLSISYDIIVNKHHGDLSVESEPGKGTTFTIRLPLAPAVAESTAQDASSQAVEAR